MARILDKTARDINHNFAVFGVDTYNKYNQYLSDSISENQFMRFLNKRCDEIQKINEIRRKED